MNYVNIKRKNGERKEGRRESGKNKNKDVNKWK